MASITSITAKGRPQLVEMTGGWRLGGESESWRGGFASAKSRGYEADDFLAAAVAKEKRHGGTAIVATERKRWMISCDKTRSAAKTFPF